MRKLRRSGARTTGTGGYYHVVLRSNRRETLFATPDDRRALNEIAIDALRSFDATLHAYCLMPNQFRILLQINERLLIKALKRIVSRYAEHRQREANCASHLFERPYEARRVDTRSDFLNLLRFIHLAPVMGNLVVEPSDYLWSSHRAYLGYKSVAQITTDFGLSLFAADRAQARAAYHQFISLGIDAAEPVDPFGVPSESTRGPDSAISESNSQTAPLKLGARALTQLRRIRARKSARRFVSIY